MHPESCASHGYAVPRKPLISTKTKVQRRMFKQVNTQAHFMEPIQHDDKLTHFTGVRTDWFIEGIVFNNAGCEYDECEEGDGSFVMHSLKFSDGSECYFEILSDGTLSHFMSSAFLELRHGLLVVTPRAVAEKDRKEQYDRVAEQARKHGRRVRKMSYELPE
jgi:hypothetical protein